MRRALRGAVLGASRRPRAFSRPAAQRRILFFQLCDYKAD